MKDLVIVRGGGDIATGVIQKLHRAGFQVLVLEKSSPLCIRRTVSAATALSTGHFQVEDLVFRRVEDEMDIRLAWAEGRIPILADEQGLIIDKLKPLVLVDAILAKKNLGTRKEMAPITIGLGPGFQAPKEVDCVIETNRGHDLGRLIFDGQAAADTGVPAKVAGFSWERVLRSPGRGTFRAVKFLGDRVEKGEVLGWVDQQAVEAGISGLLRGLIEDGTLVSPGMKIGDIDPRQDFDGLYRISDKARAIGGAVLEAVLYIKNQRYL